MKSISEKATIKAPSSKIMWEVITPPTLSKLLPIKDNFIC